jgi:hypothetical protein
MVQTLIVYLIVAVAAAWTVWRLFLRGWVKRRAAARSAAGCGPDCGCGGE